MSDETIDEETNTSEAIIEKDYNKKIKRGCFLQSLLLCHILICGKSVVKLNFTILSNSKNR